MSSPTLFENDTYGHIMTVTHFTDDLPDWLMFSYEDHRDPDNPEPAGCNVLRRDEIEELRDMLTAFLDHYPERPDPFADGGSVRHVVGDVGYDVSIAGGALEVSHE